MGMDVFGKKPINEAGKYFRNSIWWWHPLAEFLVETYPKVTSKCKDWHSNSGYGLGAKASRDLAKLVKADIRSGKVEDFERAQQLALAAIPPVACTCCDATGIRTDQLGLEAKFPERPLSPEVVELTGRTHGWCDDCDGLGTQRQALLCFSVSNVEEFSNFLENCGGFNIY